MLIPSVFKQKRFLRKFIHTILGLFLLSFLLSCGGSNGNLPLVLPEKLPHNVAVVFSDDFNMGSGDHYSVSEALHTELFNCVGNVYQNVAEEFEIPAKGEYDRIIKFTLNEIVRDEHNRRLVNATDPSLPSRYIPLRFRISVSIVSYNGENVELIQTKVVKGIGESSSGEGVAVREGAAIASSANSDSLDRAVAEAMQNVCNDVTKLLTRGFAEPKENSKTSQR
jgi:hypothetical protein